MKLSPAQRQALAAADPKTGKVQVANYRTTGPLCAAGVVEVRQVPDGRGRMWPTLHLTEAGWAERAKLIGRPATAAEVRERIGSTMSRLITPGQGRPGLHQVLVHGARGNQAQVSVGRGVFNIPVSQLRIIGVRDG